MRYVSGVFRETTSGRQFMEIVSYINKHYPIWSLLCGDHALTEEVKLVSPTLLSEPNFFDPLENSLRLELFKSKRKWIYKLFGRNVSFAIAKFDWDEIHELTTCFKGIKLREYALEHKKVFNHKKDKFSIRYKYRGKKGKHKKPLEDVEKMRLLQEKMQYNKFYHPINLDLILDTKIRNEDNLAVAVNRCFIMNSKHQSKKTIVDGNHRLTAFYLANYFRTPPKHFYAYVWEENYKG